MLLCSMRETPHLFLAGKTHIYVAHIVGRLSYQLAEGAVIETNDHTTLVGLFWPLLLWVVFGLPVQGKGE